VSVSHFFVFFFLPVLFFFFFVHHPGRRRVSRTQNFAAILIIFFVVFGFDSCRLETKKNERSKKNFRLFEDIAFYIFSFFVVLCVHVSKAILD